MKYDFSGMTLAQFQRKFPDERACMNYLISVVRPEGLVCRRCTQAEKLYKSATRRSFCCGRCGGQWHPMAGTIFHKSSTPLRVWFYGFWLVGHNPTMSVESMSRLLDTSYSAAWRLVEIIKTQYNPCYRQDRDMYRGISITPEGKYRVRIRREGVLHQQLGSYYTLAKAQEAHRLGHRIVDTR